MNFAITAIFLMSILSAWLMGNTTIAGEAVLEGVQDALSFAPKLCALVCLWSSVTELLERSGAAEFLARLLRRPLGKLLPKGAGNAEVLSALTENVGANMLGLGNAATPAGIRAARGLVKLGAQAELNILVVLNTASIQLLPTTAATLRAGYGSAAPFDITPAVWVSSVFSLLVGLTALRLFDRRPA